MEKYNPKGSTMKVQTFRHGPLTKEIIIMRHVTLLIYSNEVWWEKKNINLNFKYYINTHEPTAWINYTWSSFVSNLRYLAKHVEILTITLNSRNIKITLVDSYLMTMSNSISNNSIKKLWWILVWYTLETFLKGAQPALQIVVFFQTVLNKSVSTA